MNYLVIPDAFWSALGYSGTALAFVAGTIIALAIWGGRRGWMPTCRKCGHDLRGSAAETTSCPECGADLSRPDAVRTARARVRPALLGLGVVLGCTAGFLVWYVQPERIQALRARLVASTPLDRLIECVLGGGSGEALALESLDARSGWSGGTRTIPSGELLDGFIAAIARHDESSRGPIEARLPKLQKVASALDRDECARLAQLVCDELVLSDGTDRRLLQLALLSQQSGGSATSGLRSAIRERLKRSEDGQRMLLPGLPIAMMASSRRALDLEFSTILSAMQASGRNGVLDDGGWFLIERAEYTPAGATAPIEFRSVPLPGGSTVDALKSRARLLVDAPVGKGRLVLTGVFVPSDAAHAEERRAEAPLTPARARDLPDATPHTVETMLEVRQSPIFRPELVTDETVLDAVALACGKATFGGRASEAPRLQIDIFPRGGRGAGVPARNYSLNYSFDILVAQDGATRRIGSMMSGALSHSMVGGSMPSDVDRTRPFEIVLRPDLARVAMLDRDEARRMGGDFPWAEFRLKFPSSILPPKVEWTALPPGAPTLEPLDRTSELPKESEASSDGTGAGAETVEERLRRLVAMLDPIEIGVDAGHDEGSGISIPATISISATNAAAIALARSLPLCGTLEARADGVLIAAECIVIGSMLREDPTSFAVPSDLGEAPTIVVRYTPDPALAVPSLQGRLRFVAMPFELVYVGTKAPELRVIPRPAR